MSDIYSQLQEVYNTLTTLEIGVEQAGAYIDSRKGIISQIPYLNRSIREDGNTVFIEILDENFNYVEYFPALLPGQKNFAVYPSLDSAGKKIIKELGDFYNNSKLVKEARSFIENLIKPFENYARNDEEFTKYVKEKLSEINGAPVSRQDFEEEMIRDRTIIEKIASRFMNEKENQEISEKMRKRVGDMTEVGNAYWLSLKYEDDLISLFFFPSEEIQIYAATRGGDPSRMINLYRLITLARKIKGEEKVRECLLKAGSREDLEKRLKSLGKNGR
jgi:replicative superfamily II helicase